MHPANKIENLKRRVNRARRFPENTCPASRHAHMIADQLVRDGLEHEAASIYAVLEGLWKARNELTSIKGWWAHKRNGDDSSP